MLIGMEPSSINEANIAIAVSLKSGEDVKSVVRFKEQKHVNATERMHFHKKTNKNVSRMKIEHATFSIALLSAWLDLVRTTHILKLNVLLG